MGRLWRGMGGRRPPRRRHGRLGFHQPRDTQHGFSLFLRRLQGEQPQARPTGFSRITRHESRITAFMLPYPRFPTISRHFPRFPAPPHPPVKGPRAARSPLSCKLWSGMGRLWRSMAAAVPRAGNTAGWVFTGHETRNMVFPCSSGDSKESNPKPGQRAFHESRDTNHESRPLCFCRRFPARCGAAWGGYGAAWVPYGPRARVRAPFAVKSRQCGQNPASHRKMREVLRSPLLPSPSGLNPLR